MNYRDFADFTLDPAEVLRFTALAGQDRKQNLQVRWQRFLEQDAEKANQGMGFVSQIIGQGFSTISLGIAADQNLSYSVGFYYSFGFPELMLLSPGSDGQAAARVLTHIGASLAAARLPLGSDTDVGTRAQSMAGLLMSGLAREGLEAEELEGADGAFLRQYPYAYGWYFYAHMLDRTDVPLLSCSATRTS